MNPFVWEIRHWGYRFRSSLDDFLVVPRIRVEATEEDCWAASRRIEGLTKDLGLRKHEFKGVWDGGSQIVDHLGIRWDLARLKFTVHKRKQEQVGAHVKKLSWKA